MAKESGRISKILVVEDNTFIQHLMKAVINEEANLEPVIVSDASSAIEAWEKGNIDLILMDIILPGESGIVTTKKIREIEKNKGLKHTPIVAFTAFVTENCYRDCIDAGCDDFIGKPANMSKLMETILKYLPEHPS